ncbi:preATP grasp domain-containing protein [Micromonospora profundi]
MSTLIISNCTEEIVGPLAAVPPEKRASFGWGAQRMLWYARDGDVVILPKQPDETFLRYVTGLTRTDPATIQILTPPPGDFGPDILTPDRLGTPEIVAALAEVAAGRDITDVISIYADTSIARLVREAGCERALAGHAFCAENGVALANSKAVFRAVAAGAGVPIAPGIIARRPAEAVKAIDGLLSSGKHAMVKLDFAAGGHGNEILSPVPGVRAAGARNVVVLTGIPEIERYVQERWTWLTGGRDERFVIERYVPDAVTAYAEFSATDEGCRLRGTGEILMEPVAVGEIIPPQSVRPDVLDRLVRDGHRVCERFRHLGYRGNICADAIVAPDGEVLFTETNGRLTASTHLHHNIVARVVGPQRRDERVFLERGGKLAVGSYAGALDRLAAAGLAFDPATGTGVILTANYVPVSGRATYCVVDKDLESVRATERHVQALSDLAA